MTIPVEAKGGAVSRTPVPTLNPAQRGALEVVLNLLIPPSPDRHLPGVADYDVWGYVGLTAPDCAASIISELDRLDAEAREKFDVELAGLSFAQAQDLVQGIRAHEPKFLSRLARHATACYYQQDQVLAAIGMPVRPPFPGGYSVEPGDLSLLDPVRGREQLFRDVPDE